STSQSMKHDAEVLFASARLVATVVFPVPPLPLATVMITTTSPPFFSSQYVFLLALARLPEKLQVDQKPSPFVPHTFEFQLLLAQCPL
ncbi:MAG: hypothetical protein P8Y07_00430, partial [Gemmatimonadales bacterium]